VRIIKSMRNDVNRLVNAEIANQQKTVEAAFSQIEAINMLASLKGLENLPPALGELANCGWPTLRSRFVSSANSPIHL